MYKCTDEDLRKQLKAYGQYVGPINNSTRLYWQRALAKLQLSVLPFERASGRNKKTQVSLKKRKNATCRSRSVDSPRYTNQSSSEEEFSEFENDSILTDSPGSTPFPIKVPRNTKFSTNEIISSIETTESSESIRRHRNEKKSHFSMTPTRNSRVKYQSTQIQQGDRDLKEKLKEYGEYVHRGPINEATRNEWKKRLNQLMSPGQSNSDNEVVYPSSYESRTRMERRNKNFGIRRSHDEDYEEYKDSDSEDEQKYCIQNFHTSEWNLSECLKSFFIFLLKGIFCIVVIIVGILLLDYPELKKEFETNVT